MPELTIDKRNVINYRLCTVAENTNLQSVQYCFSSFIQQKMKGIKIIAKLYNVTYNGDSAQTLGQTIDNINQAYRTDVQNTATEIFAKYSILGQDFASILSNKNPIDTSARKNMDLLISALEKKIRQNQQATQMDKQFLSFMKHLVSENINDLQKSSSLHFENAVTQQKHRQNLSRPTYQPGACMFPTHWLKDLKKQENNSVGSNKMALDIENHIPFSDKNCTLKLT